MSHEWAWTISKKRTIHLSLYFSLQSWSIWLHYLLHYLFAQLNFNFKDLLFLFFETTDGIIHLVRSENFQNVLNEWSPSKMDIYVNVLYPSLFQLHYNFWKDNALRWSSIYLEMVEENWTWYLVHDWSILIYIYWYGSWMYPSMRAKMFQSCVRWSKKYATWFGTIHKWRSYKTFRF